MNRIKELRQARGWRQQDLAEKMNVTKASISRYELEQHQLDPATICTICDLFDVSADYLLGRSSTPKPAITDADAEILAAYRAAPDHVRTAIGTLLEPYKKKDALSAS